MISAQLIKSRFEELHNLTKTALAVHDPDGKALYTVQPEAETDEGILREFASSSADTQTVGETVLLKVFDEDEVLNYVIVAKGGPDPILTGRIAAGELRLLHDMTRDKPDKNSFYQSLLMDNMLLVDIYNKAKRLRIESAVPRVVYVVDTKAEDDSLVAGTLKGMFDSRTGDHVTAINETTVILIKVLDGSEEPENLKKIAQSIVDTISAEAMVDVRVSFGTVVQELKEVSRSYKEAMMAAEVGKIFYARRKVNSYASLGIGRLIYQIPESQCRVFLDEIFGEVDPASIDEEIVATVYKFFENSLNVSETARQLFIHRNTLVYRVEKLKALTGLDVRNFDDALTFVIAMMVHSMVIS